MKNFVLVFSFSTPEGPVEVYRELEGTRTDQEGLARALLDGCAVPVARGSFSVQHEGSGRYFETGGECLRYLLERWGLSLLAQMVRP